MYIYHKQCGILQKIQWKGSNGQLQWFNKATSGALCWKRQKTPKLKKLKRKLLKILKRYDLSRVVPCQRARPEHSENVIVFKIWSFWTIVIACQSQVKCKEKMSGEGGVKKNKTATIMRFERCHWISVEPTMWGPCWFNGSAQNSKLWPCLFF